MSHTSKFKHEIKRRKRRRGKRIYTKYIQPKENLKLWRNKK